MASTVTVSASARIDDGVLAQINAAANPASFAVGVGTNGQRQTVSLSGSAFTALTVPSGAKGIFIPSPPVSLTLKGVTGDTGVTITGATTNGVPIMLPLTGTPSLGLANGGSSATVDVIFF